MKILVSHTNIFVHEQFLLRDKITCPYFSVAKLGNPIIGFTVSYKNINGGQTSHLDKINSNYKGVFHNFIGFSWTQFLCVGYTTYLEIVLMKLWNYQHKTYQLLVFHVTKFILFNSLCTRGVASFLIKRESMFSQTAQHVRHRPFTCRRHALYVMSVRQTTSINLDGFKN